MAPSKVVANSICALFGHTIVPECAVDIQVPRNYNSITGKNSPYDVQSIRLAMTCQVWIAPDLDEEIDIYLRMDNCASRSEFVEKALRFYIGYLNTKKGTRTIILPQSIVELLRQRKKRAVSQWIFPNPLKPEMPTSPDSAYRHLKILLGRAGLPDIRFHDAPVIIGVNQKPEHSGVDFVPIS